MSILNTESGLPPWDFRVTFLGKVHKVKLPNNQQIRRAKDAAHLGIRGLVTFADLLSELTGIDRTVVDQIYADVTHELHDNLKALIPVFGEVNDSVKNIVNQPRLAGSSDSIDGPTTRPTNQGGDALNLKISVNFSDTHSSGQIADRIAKSLAPQLRQIRKDQADRAAGAAAVGMARASMGGDAQ
jgi:hypothetical protein